MATNTPSLVIAVFTDHFEAQRAIDALQRAVGLTADPGRRTERALAAAELSFQAGELDTAQRLLATAESYQLDGFQAARATLLRGHVAVAFFDSMMRCAARGLFRQNSSAVLSDRRSARRSLARVGATIALNN